MSFSDKVVLVTGASSGIGAATAIKFAEQSAKVVLVGRNEDKLNNVSKRCKEVGGHPLIIVADVTKDEDAKRLVSEAINTFGRLDVLVNNAGIFGNCSITADDALVMFDRIIDTNLRSVVKITNLAAGHLIETKGNIINISSVAGLTVALNFFAYCSSKAALDHFTRCIALELAPKGVRVNSVNPGPVKTDIIENMGVDKANAEKAWEDAKEGTALNRISDPEEVADLVLFLASDQARGITGSIYVTDNGTLLKGMGKKLN